MIVYIWGNLTSDNFTPRPGKDTLAQPGQAAGLSAWSVISPGKKAQGIEIDMFRPPLRAIPDDTRKGGQRGHYAIAPVNDRGEIDVAKLEAWAMTRGTGQTHALTQTVLDAVVEPNAKGST